MKKIALLILILWAPIIWSQKYKYGKVSKAELEEKTYPLDTTANAAVLYSERKATFEYDKEDGFVLEEKHFKRIKIYNPEGYYKATQEIELFHNINGEVVVNGINAKTYTLENGKIIKTKLAKKNIFTEEKNKYINTKTFTMPNLQPGCVVEWKYTLRTPFFSMFDKVELQDDIPIKKIKIRIATPEYYNYNTRTTGFLHIPIKTTQKERTVTYSNFERTGGGFSSGKIRTSTNKTSAFNFVEKIQLIEMSNIPALKDEFRSGNINNYMAGIDYELSFIKLPNKPINNIAADWEAVVKKIYFRSAFGEQLKKKNHFKDELDVVLQGKNSIPEKISTIYQFVKGKIKWNSYDGKYSEEGVKKAYKKGVGNVADINLNLVAMLKYAGLEASPVLVSTVDHGIPLFPTRYGFNYVIAHVQTPNGYVLLDATEKNALPNILPERVLNFQGRKVSDEGKSELIRLFPSKHAVKITVIKTKFNEDILKGIARKTITGNLLLAYRDEVRDKSKESLLEWLDEYYEGVEVLNARVSNLDKLGKDGTETIQFEIESFYDEIAGKIYFSPLLYTQLTENPFKSKKREFPVFFNYPKATINEINIAIPEAYTIETLPETANYHLPEDMGLYSYSITQEGQNIKVSSKLLINEPVIPANHYNALKEFYKKVIEKQAEKVVLVKK